MDPNVSIKLCVQWMGGLNWANLEGTWHELAVKKTLANQHRRCHQVTEHEGKIRGATLKRTGSLVQKPSLSVH